VKFADDSPNISPDVSNLPIHQSHSTFSSSESASSDSYVKKQPAITIEGMKSEEEIKGDSSRL
jgi:hypothetical protein